MPTPTKDRQASWFSNALNSLARALRPGPAVTPAAAQKLEPIADIVSRTGREDADAK